MFEGAPPPKPPKPSLWDWIKYYLFNLYRKPMVYRRQKELLYIAQDVRHALDVEVMPKLWHARLVCKDCRDAFMMIKPQIFLSQIEMILKSYRCEDHGELFAEFLERHGAKFRRSEDIAAWINGFKR